jgi:uncharacterized protein (DUF305 family)
MQAMAETSNTHETALNLTFIRVWVPFGECITGQPPSHLPIPIRHMKEHEQKGHYPKLAWMVTLHFIAMYVLMYAMVYELGSNVYNSLGQVYMAALMTASMGAIEMVLMGAMYPNKARNAVIVAMSMVILAGSWMAIREQFLIGDRQFLRSMIPHHAGAILMCKEAKVQDREVQDLCKRIITSQQTEIDEMKTILKRMD